MPLLFVMTGFSSSEFMDDDPLREAVLGVTSLENVSEYIAHTEHSKIAEIVQALENFDMDRVLANFSMEARKKADLYPIFGIILKKRKKSRMIFEPVL